MLDFTYFSFFDFGDLVYHRGLMQEFYNSFISNTAPLFPFFIASKTCLISAALGVKASCRNIITHSSQNCEENMNQCKLAFAFFPRLISLALGIIRASYGNIITHS